MRRVRFPAHNASTSVVTAWMKDPRVDTDSKVKDPKVDTESNVVEGHLESKVVNGTGDMEVLRDSKVVNSTYRGPSLIRNSPPPLGPP